MAEARAVNGTISSAFGRCTFGAVDRTDLARRIYAAAHLTGTFTLRSGSREPRVLRQVPLRVGSAAAGRHRGRVRQPRPARHRRARRARARRRAPRDDDLAGHAAARRSSCARRPRPTAPASSPRAPRSTAGACASSRTSSPRAARSSTRRRSCAPAARELGPVICVIDRESGGREKLAVDDLELVSLYTMSELKAAAAAGA